MNRAIVAIPPSFLSFLDTYGIKVDDEYKPVLYRELLHYTYYYFYVYDHIDPENSMVNIIDNVVSILEYSMDNQDIERTNSNGELISFYTDVMGAIDMFCRSLIPILYSIGFFNSRLDLINVENKLFNNNMIVLC